MSRSNPKPSFNPAKHPTFAGKSEARAVTDGHRTAAIAAPPKPTVPPSWKPPKPDHSPRAASKFPQPEHSHNEPSQEYGYKESFEAPATTSGPGFGGGLQSAKAPFHMIGD